MNVRKRIRMDRATQLRTGYGILNLPDEGCLMCFSSFRFMRCTCCPVTADIRACAKKRFDEWWDTFDHEQTQDEIN